MENLTKPIDNLETSVTPLIMNYGILADLFFYPENESYKENE